MPSTPTLTAPADETWGSTPASYRRWEKSAVLGHGDDVWRWVSAELLRWGVKTRSGFAVAPEGPAETGARPVIVAHAFGLSVREPVEVVAVVQTPDRVGFAYRTLAGHPVSGEEAFIAHRRDDDVMLTIRSLTRPGDRAGWRAAYPALLVAQQVARRRYFRALRLRAGG
ncbi:DUF1990 family protein [Microbacterium flavescens]|uniref:DUF1990 family protein n=1 Tax=Microbacterium flavescens TaxID=69366 RepID=UPI001BDEBA0D|nr:DUF1990 domain-containing protein [Microbacterium flavescens]BFF10010.1 DUF1990 domain-containing protein [Microbacterium flavescens]